MTVKELIEELEKIKDKDKIVVYSEEGWEREVDQIEEYNEVWLDW